MVKKQPKKNNVKIRKNPNDQKKKFTRKLTLFDSKFTREWKNDLGKATDGIMNVKEMKEIEKYLESKGKRGGRRTRKKKRGGKMTMEELQAKLAQARMNLESSGTKNIEQRLEKKMSVYSKNREKALNTGKLRAKEELWDQYTPDIIKQQKSEDQETQEKIIKEIENSGGKRKTKKRRRKKRRKRKSKRKRKK